MPIEIVEALFRYPVKSMAGERLETANLGWYGLDGDRRLAFRRIDNRSGMPWLTASKLPDLVLLLRCAVKKVLREIFLRTFGRPMAQNCLSSEMSWQPTSNAGSVPQSR
jgi:uncharacterized protein YcbX